MDDEENDSEEEPELIGPNNLKLHVQVANKKIKPLCKTRWVECHTALKDFKDLYEPLPLCLPTIFENQNRKWDSKSKTEAQGLFHQIKRPEFICLPIWLHKGAELLSTKQHT